MKITLLGTGLLGTAVAMRLQRNNCSVTAYNRTHARTEPLKKFGVEITGNLSAAIEKSEGVILTLTDARAVEEVLFTGEALPLEGKTVIQMGTISPRESIAIQKKVYKSGGSYFESPVLGSRNEAMAGKLIVMVGGTKDKFEKWESLLKILGNTCYVGEVGKAAALKLALNQLIASHAAGFSASLAMVEKNGIDVNLFRDILAESALYAPMFDKKFGRWVKRDYSDPNFSTRHLLKDVELVLEEAEEKGIYPDILKAVRGAVLKASQGASGDLDYSSVYEVIRQSTID